MEEKGAYISKIEALSTVERMEDTVLGMLNDKDSGVTEEAALYALRALAGVRQELNYIKTYCIASAGVQRRNGCRK